MPGLSLGPGAGDRPGFGVLLANSLRSEGATKAWFDEAGGYAYVRQSRVPLVLPKVLAPPGVVGSGRLWAAAGACLTAALLHSTLF